MWILIEHTKKFSVYKMNENLMWPQVLLLLWDINMLNSRKLMSHKTEQLKFFDFDILRQGHM